MIPMQWENKVTCEVGRMESLCVLQKDDGQILPTLSVFSSLAESFLQKLSACLMADSLAKSYPDVITFAFFCRRSHIRQLAQKFAETGERLGRGVVFHIAPSNVALNFAYSWVAALLAGNASVVRLPSKSFPQVEIICKAVRQVLADMPELVPYIFFLRYGHDEDVNTALSALCSTRVIWGGDKTIREIRNFPLGIRANEIVFADRFGLAVIDSDAYLQADNLERIAQDFFNDTYLSDQNACNSPRFVIWLGTNKVQARAKFWRQLQELLDKHYELGAVQVVDKLVKACLLGAECECRLQASANNLLTRVEVKSLTRELIEYTGNSGFFIEYEADELNDIKFLLTERCQTISYYGAIKEDILSMVKGSGCRGGDRIVPMGRTLDFSLIWDGYNLISAMSREIDVV